MTAEKILKIIASGKTGKNGKKGFRLLECRRGNYRRRILRKPNGTQTRKAHTLKYCATDCFDGRIEGKKRKRPKWVEGILIYPLPLGSIHLIHSLNRHVGNEGTWPKIQSSRLEFKDSSVEE